MDRDGATLVGMTGMPEAALARDSRCPTAVCVVVNHAEGGGRQRTADLAERIANVLEKGMDRVHALLRTSLRWRDRARRQAMIATSCAWAIRASSNGRARAALRHARARCPAR